MRIQKNWIAAELWAFQNFRKSQNRDSRKLIKYTCFRKSRKMAILRGSKLENYWSDWNEILTDKNIRRDLFNAGLRPKKYWIAAELWASQNRDFSKISKTRVFYHFWEFSKIWRKWPFFLIKIRKERKNPDFRHILDQNPIFWVNTPQKFEKIEFLKMAFVCQIEPSNGQIGDF